MIKKVVKVLILLLILVNISIPNVYAAANTLKDLKNQLAALKKQKSENDASKSRTQSEINNENNLIASAYRNIEKAENDIEQAKKDIDKSNNEIESAKGRAANMLVFYEIMDGDDTFMDYVSNAETMTEMVMRMDAISQILKYNQSQITNLEQMIDHNKQLQVDLTKKQEQLTKDIDHYKDKLASLKNDLSKLDDLAVDIKDEIKAQEELIKYYESIGCKDNDLLSACVDINNNTRWYRPLTRGYISSRFGYRTITLNGVTKTSYHGGLDVAGNAGGTPIYSALNGTVAAIIRKASCGGNQVFIHARVNGAAYTVQYAHMLDIYVKVGDKVTVNTVVGTVGGGGSTLKKNGGWDTCSTGYHLHYAVAHGFYFGGGPEGYSSYSTFTAKKISPPNMPDYGKWFYSRI